MRAVEPLEDQRKLPLCQDIHLLLAGEQELEAQSLQNRPALRAEHPKGIGKGHRLAAQLLPDLFVQAARSFR